MTKREILFVGLGAFCILSSSFLLVSLVTMPLIPSIFASDEEWCGYCLGCVGVLWPSILQV